MFMKMCFHSVGYPTEAHGMGICPVTTSMQNIIQAYWKTLTTSTTISRSELRNFCTFVNDHWMVQIIGRFIWTWPQTRSCPMTLSSGAWWRTDYHNRQCWWRLVSSLSGCWAFLFEVRVSPVSITSESVNCQFDSILFYVLQSHSLSGFKFYHPAIKWLKLHYKLLD